MMQTVNHHLKTVFGQRVRRAALSMVCLPIASGAFATAALAAGLEGDCCADLEERIAELEATTARKGNRKLSLTVSGQVNQAILAWDDGNEQNVYQVMNSNSSDRVRFDGAAAVMGDLKAGHYLELGLGLDSTARTDQFARGADNDVGVRQSIWYLDSKSLGAVSVGLGAPATDDIIAYNLGGTSVAASANTSLVGGSLFTRDSTLGGPAGLNSLSSGNTISLRWRRFVDRLDTPIANMVRYDTPVFMGFAASASWGADDYWDVALRYARETQDFKFAFGIGYFEDQNETEDTLSWPRGGDTEPNGRDTEIRELKGSASILHIPSGLFLSGAYVHREFSGNDLGVLTFACFASGDAADIRAQGVGCTNRPDFDYFWISAGIRQKFFSIGATSIYGEYGRSMDAITGLNVSVTSAVGGDIDYVTSSSMDIWGLGLVQQIRDAGMDVYFSYRHFEADVEGLESGGGRLVAPLEDADLFMAGSRIRF